jgi:hypothetical protein
MPAASRERARTRRVLCDAASAAGARDYNDRCQPWFGMMSASDPLDVVIARVDPAIG